MNRKLFFIGITFFLLTLLSTLNQSCENILSYDATICTLEFTGLNPSYDNSPDKFSTEIGFLITGSYDRSACYAPDFGLVSTCYATSKCAKWKNDLIPSSFQLLVDRPVLISGDTVKPNTDLFQNQIFKNNTAIDRNKEDCKFVQFTILFSKDLVSKIIFEPGVYNITFNCSSTDNRTFTNKRQVIFKQ